MEPADGGQPTSSAARRSLRAARIAAAAQPATDGNAAPVPPGSESPRSDVSDGRASRSSRLSNPEFAAKHKAFMAKVTAATKGSMDTYLTAESAAAVEVASCAASGKRRLSPRAEDQKRRRSTRTNSAGLDIQNDSYCWICHKVENTFESMQRIVLSVLVTILAWQFFQIYVCAKSCFIVCTNLL